MYVFDKMMPQLFNNLSFQLHSILWIIMAPRPIIQAIIDFSAGAAGELTLS